MFYLININHVLCIMCHCIYSPVAFLAILGPFILIVILDKLKQNGSTCKTDVVHMSQVGFPEDIIRADVSCCIGLCCIVLLLYWIVLSCTTIVLDCVVLYYYCIGLCCLALQLHSLVLLGDWLIGSLLNFQISNCN